MPRSRPSEPAQGDRHSDESSLTSASDHEGGMGEEVRSRSSRSGGRSSSARVRDGLGLSSSSDDDDEGATDRWLSSALPSRVQRLGTSLHLDSPASAAAAPAQPGKWAARAAAASAAQSAHTAASAAAATQRSIPPSPVRSHSHALSARPSAVSSPASSRYFTSRVLGGGPTTSSSGDSALQRVLGSDTPRSSVGSETSAVAQLKAQLADREIALAQERNKRFAAQAELEQHTTKSSASFSTLAASPARSHASSLGRSSFFNNHSTTGGGGGGGGTSTDTHNPELAHWNSNLQSLHADQARKVSTLGALVEEQSREMALLRSERNEFVARHEVAVRDAAAAQDTLRSRAQALEAHGEIERARADQAAHQASLLQNELALLDERARSDVGQLLDKLQAAKGENQQLRAVLVQEKEKAEAREQETQRLHEGLDTAHLRAEALQQSATKYKTKARDLVIRVRATEAQRVELQRTVRALNDSTETLQDRLSHSEHTLSTKTTDLEDLQREHTQLREELFGKTRELTDLYAAYATVVEKHQEATRNFQEELQHHARISQLVGTVSASAAAAASPKSPPPQVPRSHQMQLDLHKALADKQAEVLRLQGELQASRQDAHTARMQLADSNAGGDQAELAMELTALRARLERRMAENIELASEKKDLTARLQTASRAAQHQQQQPSSPPPSQHLSHTFGGHTTSSGGPSSSTNSQHLYQQIVELHETVRTLERACLEKDTSLDQVRGSLRAAIETRTALAEQVDVLSSHLAEFQSRVLPSPQEFRTQKEAQVREWQETIARLKKEEEEWRHQVQREREAMLAQQASEESFVAKAIAIHTSELSSEVDSLSALMSSRQNGLEPGIEHLVPKPTVHDSTLSLPQTEDVLQRSVSDLRSFRRYIADEYARGLAGQECAIQ